MKMPLGVSQTLPRRRLGATAAACAIPVLVACAEFGQLMEIESTRSERGWIRREDIEGTR